MIEIGSESLVSITAAAKEFPGRPHRSTIWRFALRGVRGVRLETIVSGGRRFTSREAIERFVAACTAAANGEPSPVQASKKRLQEKAWANQKLRDAGVIR